jgi:hypothetical protein
MDSSRAIAGGGHPDMRSFSKNIGAAKTFPEMEEIVREADGVHLSYDRMACFLASTKATKL